MPDYRLHHGDCLEVLKALPDGCVHSVVTDPPYGLSFMGKKWDYGVPSVDIWRECLRALKPGGHLLAFGGSRTYHRLACAVEDAGFEIRDQIQWVYGSGFPKSLDVGKAIDKQGGNPLAFQKFARFYANAVASSSFTHSDIDRALGVKSSSCYWAREDHRGGMPPRHHWNSVKAMIGLSNEFDALYDEAEREVLGIKSVGIKNGAAGGSHEYGLKASQVDITAPATEAAKQWDGWGSALKPAFEPLVVGYKPLINIDEFDIMVREVIETLCQSTSIARIAEKSFQSNHVGAGQSIAQWVADGNINIEGVLSVLTDTLRSESVTNTNLSIASLWLDTLAVLYSQANTFTTETKISLTIELRILRSLPLANILEHIIRGETPQNGDATSAYTARNIFNVVIEKLRHILEHSVPETAMSKAGQTGLLPNHEPIVMARKPLDGTIAGNVLRHGTGAINIDGCRVGLNDYDREEYIPNRVGYKDPENYRNPAGEGVATNFSSAEHNTLAMMQKGRFPANVIHDGSDEVVGLFPRTTSGKVKRDKPAYGNDSMFLNGVSNQSNQHGDSGSAARFFYCAKASKSDRDEGLEGFKAIHRVNGNKWTDQDYRVSNGERPPSAESGPRKNVHPTVKPTDLMRYLCRLITPPGGTVLDPFAGSGSTGKAAVLEGFRFVGIEREAEYIAIAEARIRHAGRVQPLFAKEAAS